jgi:putative ABC transport system permease protein
MRNLRHACHVLARSPGFALTTILTLAIGIGATTAIFSVVNGILIKPLPFPESDRLIALRHQAPAEGAYDQPASAALYFTYAENNETFESVTLWSSGMAGVTGGGDPPEEVRQLQATHEFLSTLRIQPVLGRGFTQADGAEGGPDTVILSHPYWQRRFGGNQNVIGRSLVVDGEPREIVGILPQGFRFLQEAADILVPWKLSRQFSFIPSIGPQGIARLRDGVTLERAEADARRMMPILFESFPFVPGFDRARLERMQFGPSFRPLKDDIIGDLDEVLWVLMGTIGILLVIACANVANLELVRTEARGSELAIRLALGASWGRIARLILLESLSLGLIGGAAGVVLAASSLPLLLSVAAQDLPGVLTIAIDWNVVLFAVIVALLSGLLFGLIPALKYARPKTASMLSLAARAYSATRERHRTRNALVVAQVSLAVILLVASGLMIRTFQSLSRVDPGYTQPERIQTITLSIPRAEVPEHERTIRMFNDIQNRLAAVPGVDSVGFSSYLPLPPSGPDGPYFLEEEPTATPLSYEFRYTSPDFFQSLGTPIIAGRDFEWADNYDASRQLVIVSENLARQAWGSPAAAIGKRLGRNTEGPWLEVVGVVGDIRYDGLQQPSPSTIYHTFTEQFAPFAIRTMSFAIRSERSGMPGFVEALQEAIWSVNANLPLASVQTLGDLHVRAMARTSLVLTLLAATATMALFLGLVGIYGVIAYMLSSRARELGIRMALGAQDDVLTRMLMRQVIGIVTAGVVIGLGMAMLLSRAIESQLFGVTSLDPLTYVSVCGLLVLTTIVAGYLPARRVTHIDPTQALRAE